MEHSRTIFQVGEGTVQAMVTCNTDEVGLHDDNDALDNYVAQHLDGEDRVKILTDAGWDVTGEIKPEGPYLAVDVEPRDWLRIIKVVTERRKQVAVEAARSEYAYKTVITDAMNADATVKTEVAEAAGISRERAYQIRDGRR